jgi:Flp pilus assembly protein TadD
LEETARLQRDFGRSPEALAAATRITVVEPTNPQGYAIVARIWLDSMDFRRAEEAIGKALAIDAEFPPALAELGRLQILRESLGGGGGHLRARAAGRSAAV